MDKIPRLIFEQDSKLDKTVLVNSKFRQTNIISLDSEIIKRLVNYLWNLFKRTIVLFDIRREKYLRINLVILTYF